MAWLSLDTLRRIAAWQHGAGMTAGPLFRRIGVLRSKARQAEPLPAFPAPPGYTWRLPVGTQRPLVRESAPATTTFVVGELSLTPAAVRLIIKRNAMRAVDEHLVNLRAVNSMPRPRC